MEHVYVLFEMVRASAVFVVKDGGLRGMISRDRLLDSLKTANAATLIHSSNDIGDKSGDKSVIIIEEAVISPLATL